MNRRNDEATQVQKLFVDDGIVIAGFSARTTKGACFVIEAGDLTTKSLDEAIAGIGRRTDDAIDRLEWKLVGHAAPVAVALAHLQQSKVNVKAVPRSRGRMEVLYYPASGRLRVAAAAGGAVVEPRRTRVLIVDDSVTIQKLLAKILGSDPSLEVVAVSGKPTEVEALVQKHDPDVITLDIHMPEMDGVTLLKQLLRRRPVRAVMISSLRMEDGPMVLSALEAGAVDYIQKPTAKTLESEAPVIIERVKVAARAKLVQSKDPVSVKPISNRALDRHKLLAIGSSTGGTEALRAVLTRMPAEIPPTLVVQHIPAGFSRAFAERLDSLCPFTVKEAVDGDEVLPNQVLIAPGGMHMRLVRRGKTLRVVVEETPHVNRHRPSVDVLFDSVAELVGAQAVGVILTGMGGDGARGLLKMKEAGAATVGQDEGSCVVYGMPREAAKIGAVQHVVALDMIPDTLVSLLGSGSWQKKRAEAS